MRILATALLLMIAEPAFAQAPDELYQQGVEARLAGQNDRAAELLSRLVASDPGNADAQLQYGLALLALNRLNEAEAALLRTLALAPDYQDARIALARLEQKRGRPERALAELERVDPDNAEAVSLRRQLAARRGRAARWRLDIDGSYSFLDHAQPDWKEGSLRLTHQASPATAIAAAIEHGRRFGRKDSYGELRIDQRFAGGNAYFFAGGAVEADFLPEWQLAAGGAARIMDGANPTFLTIDARHADYRQGAIHILNPGVDQYFAGGRAWISLRWINSFDDGNHESGWLARGDMLVTEKLRLFAGAADAPDTNQGVVTETFSLFGGLSYDMNEQMTLRASIAWEDRETGAERTQLGFGASFRF